MTTRIKLRRDDTTNWEALNPVLALGEPGFDLTENKIKIGDGVSAWMDLAYIESGLPIASNIALGGIKVGNNLTITGDGTLNAEDGNYTLPIASNIVLGGIKVGNNLTITGDGTLNAEDGNYTLPAATTNVLGGVKLGEGFVLDGNNKVTTSKLYSTNLTEPNQHYRLEVDTNGVVVLPDQSIINGSTLKGIAGTGELNYTGIVTGPSSGNSENTWMYIDAYDAYIATDYADSQHTWKFDRNGNLTLPVGGDILNSSGQSVLGGGGNANTGNFTFDEDTISNDNGLLLATDRGTLAIGTNMEGPGVPGHFHIAFDGSNINAPSNDLFLGDDYNYVKLPGDTITPYGVEIGAHNRDGGDSHNWRFETDGNLVLPQGSKISDQATSVDLTVGRSSDNPLWYNIFGDTGATNSANITINGSVVRDTGGNVYAIGSLIHGDGSFDADNLFLKYSPLGELLWRRTWTDNNGLNCGSYNASVRYVEANVDLGTQDTIVWAASVPLGGISYVGTMDTEGNMVDQFGVARLATRLGNVKVTDLEWTGNIGGVTNSVVGVVGQYYDPGPGDYIPFIGEIDLDTAQFIGNITVTPAGSDQTNAGGVFNIPYTNTFKAVATPAAGSEATVGTYYDSTYSHAMLAFSNGGPTTTIGIGVDSNGTDNVSGEDLCCDANGNVYVIVNNITSNYAVLIKSNLNNLATGNSFWQKQLGFDYPAGDSFRATTVAYDNGYVYVLGQYYDDSTGDTDAMIIKVGIGNGNVVWQRRIGSPGDDGVSFYGADGSESSSGITVQDGLIAVSFVTEARTPGLGGGTELNTVTLQYPVDGSILGTFGDFVISDFDVGNISTDYSITTLTTTLGNVNLTSGFATLNPTVQTVGTGWTNTQWDLENNIQIFDPQTFKFNIDGTFDTAEIRHQGEVKITANTTVANAVPSTWTFQNNDGLRFPDGTVQYGAYVETEMMLDGGSAITVFPITVTTPRFVEGGGSGSRYGTTSPTYEGGTGGATLAPIDFTLLLNGGGA
jgi:hypothetical protein